MSHRRASHRARRRRRGGRLSVLTLTLAVTTGVGGTAVAVLPQVQSSVVAEPQDEPVAQGADDVVVVSDSASEAAATTEPTPDPEPVELEAVQTEAPASTTVVPEVPALPAASGEGRRIVFSESEQRVWLVEADQTVARSYLVSGSLHDNLDPGTYAVQSRTRHATAFDYSGTMEYFVRFTAGANAPIGFHSVPKDNQGRLEQTEEQLGTPQSAGCVRQWLPDAVALWDFAPVGTTVVVTA